MGQTEAGYYSTMEGLLKNLKQCDILFKVPLFITCTLFYNSEGDQATKMRAQRTTLTKQ